LPAGDVQLKLTFLKGGSNINYITFSNPRPVDQAEFVVLHGETSKTGNQLYLFLSKEITGHSLEPGDFDLVVGGRSMQVVDVQAPDSSFSITLKPAELIHPDLPVSIGYVGGTALSDGQVLGGFESKKLGNGLEVTHPAGRKIQAEYATKNYGFTIEKCYDSGGGFNTGYADRSDYLDYLVYIPDSGVYQLDLRVALGGGNMRVSLQHNQSGEFEEVLSHVLFSTGGWQSWETQAATMELPAGKYIFRLQVKFGEFNLNWLQFNNVTGTFEIQEQSGTRIYPNPAGSFVTVEFDQMPERNEIIEIFDSRGIMLMTVPSDQRINIIDTGSFIPGIYFIRKTGREKPEVHKLIVN